MTRSNARQALNGLALGVVAGGPAYILVAYIALAAAESMSAPYSVGFIIGLIPLALLLLLALWMIVRKRGSFFLTTFLVTTIGLGSCTTLLCYRVISNLHFGF